MHPITPPASRRAALAALAALASATGLLAMSTAHAQSNWPTRPVTVISPYAPGGTNDVVARLMADRLQKALGQPFVVENKPGAAGILGSTLVMQAPADGYTLLSGNNGSHIVQAVVKEPRPYDPAANFTPIVKMADAPNYIGVSGDLPVKNVAELVALARREPGKLNYSSAGSGSFGNFTAEYFKLLTGTDIVHIPAKGSAAALTELMSGRIQLMIDPLVLSQRQGGRVKVLATTLNERVEGYADIPTVKESGGPEINFVGWFGLLAPANLPREVVEKIEGVLKAASADPEVRKQLTAAGLVGNYVGSAAFGTLIREDARRYADIKTRAKLVVE